MLLTRRTLLTIFEVCQLHVEYLAAIAIAALAIGPAVLRPATLYVGTFLAMKGQLVFRQHVWPSAMLV